jgi:hypothetical protein
MEVVLPVALMVALMLVLLVVLAMGNYYHKAFGSSSLDLYYLERL